MLVWLYGKEHTSEERINRETLLRTSRLARIMK